MSSGEYPSPDGPAEPPSNRDRFVRADHSVKEVKSASARGGALTFSAQIIKFVLNLGSTMILARLLTPEDYGLIGMVTVLLGFLQMFKDAGLSTATVQRERLTHEQVSTVFWFNVAFGLALALLFAPQRGMLSRWWQDRARLKELGL